MRSAVLCRWWALAAVAGVMAALAGAMVARAADDGLRVEVKLGLSYLSKAQRVDLWDRVDKFAAVDAMHEFCGARKLNIQRRAWRAVGPCIEPVALRQVAATFRSKKASYIKAWETVHNDPEKKKKLCDQWKGEMPKYARIIDANIAEAASMCSSCLFC